MFRSQLIIGGDFNTHLYLDTELDRYGGRVDKKKSSVKNIMEIKLAFVVIDVWQIRKPKKIKFTWLARK